jgi:cytochrome oxidase assembly protein ShyY1
MKRLPILPTIIVLASVALMIALGLWQLDRAAEKKAQLVRYAAATKLPEIAFPAIPAGEALLFRKASGFCLTPVHETVDSGRSAKGKGGWRHIVSCRTGAEGPGMIVDIGWSPGFAARSLWKGGAVKGVIAQQPQHVSLIARALGKAPPQSLMLVASEATQGLEPSAPPNLAEVPNNHLSYAVQWFVFAGLALLIYGLALRRRRR